MASGKAQFAIRLRRPGTIALLGSDSTMLATTAVGAMAINPTSARTTSTSDQINSTDSGTFRSWLAAVRKPGGVVHVPYG